MDKIARETRNPNHFLKLKTKDLLQTAAERGDLCLINRYLCIYLLLLQGFFECGKSGSPSSGEGVDRGPWTP